MVFKNTFILFSLLEVSHKLWSLSTALGENKDVSSVKVSKLSGTAIKMHTNVAGQTAAYSKSINGCSKLKCAWCMLENYCLVTETRKLRNCGKNSKTVMHQKLTGNCKRPVTISLF